MLPLASFIFGATILSVHLFALAVSSSSDSLSPSSLLNHTSTASSPEPFDTFCHGSQSWRGIWEFDWRFRASCDNAAKMLWAREVKQHTNTEYEFLDYRTRPAHDNPLMRTPRRYSYSECTIALVMINDIPAKYIDDRRPWLAPATDITSYNDIWHAVDGIWQECLIDNHSLGWANVGFSSALAVLVFGANSPIDQEIPYGVHPLGIGNFTTTGGLSIAEQ